MEYFHKMSGCFVIEPFEDCPFFSKVRFTELTFFKKHLVLHHDFNELLKFAFNKGLIQDPIRYHSKNFVIDRIAEFCKVKGI